MYPTTVISTLPTSNPATVPTTPPLKIQLPNRHIQEVKKGKKKEALRAFFLKVWLAHRRLLSEAGSLSSAASDGGRTSRASTTRTSPTSCAPWAASVTCSTSTTVI